MKINFLHPRTSVAFEADVDPITTGETCIHGLIDANFVDQPPPDRPYSLLVTRTQRQVLPATTMQEAGVKPGDSLAICQMEQGA